MQGTLSAKFLRSLAKAVRLFSRWKKKSETHYAYPNAMKAKFSYMNATNQKRLQQIRYENASNALISSHEYEYSPAGNITQWVGTRVLASPRTLAFGYDKINQLTSVLETQNNTTVNDYAYLYDLAGNRLQEQVNGASTRSLYNNLNQLTTRDASGNGSLMRFSGEASAESWVMVNDVPAKKLPGNRFEAWLPMREGANKVEIVAYDTAKEKLVETYSVNVPPGDPREYCYDAAGNLEKVGTYETHSYYYGGWHYYDVWDYDVQYKWNGKKQLVEIWHDEDTTTEFEYDAQGRRVKIVEHSFDRLSWTWNATERRFLWLPGMNHPAEERDASNNVVRRFFAQGEQVVGAAAPNDKLFYGKDHLGSVRELINTNFTSQTNYDYDPFGRRTKVSGNIDTVVSYTGHHWHEKSGLYLTWYRQYDPNLGRWLSRDPIEEDGGINLYGYVENDSINRSDPLGQKSLNANAPNPGPVPPNNQTQPFWARNNTGPRAPCNSPHLPPISQNPATPARTSQEAFGNMPGMFTSGRLNTTHGLAYNGALADCKRTPYNPSMKDCYCCLIVLFGTPEGQYVKWSGRGTVLKMSCDKARKGGCPNTAYIRRTYLDEW